MEVSSDRPGSGPGEGDLLHAAIFTNLTLDHLDYHKTMEAYCAAKAKLFAKAVNWRSSMAMIRFPRSLKRALCNFRH